METYRDQSLGIETPQIPAENALKSALLETLGLQRLDGGRTRARTWDPMIKNYLD
jgi:hypothetical protein